MLYIVTGLTLFSLFLSVLHLMGGSLEVSGIAVDGFVN